MADTHLGEKEMREVIEYLETMGIEACGTPAYNDGEGKPFSFYLIN